MNRVVESTNRGIESLRRSPHGKNDLMRYCKLIDEEGFDQSAHLDTLQMVIEHMPDAQLVAILKKRRKGGRRDWPVAAMLNALYALLVLQYRSMASLRHHPCYQPDTYEDLRI